MKHTIIRTSPFGGEFIGYCPLCGKEGLPMEAAREDCENVVGATHEDAISIALNGGKQ